MLEKMLGDLNNRLCDEGKMKRRNLDMCYAKSER
jgi:hypothetical protein